jgi:hypothetical protein
VVNGNPKAQWWDPAIVVSHPGLIARRVELAPLASHSSRQLNSSGDRH